MTAAPMTEVRTSDVLRDGVHHHTYASKWVQDSGVPCRTACGIVKRQSPDAWELPCCPMCAAVLERHGTTCRAEEARS